MSCKNLLYLLSLFLIYEGSEWKWVRGCAAQSSLEREFCFSFEMQRPLWSAELIEIKWLICTSHRIMWAVVFKLCPKCQKHILSVQYSRYKAWNYLDFQMLCQPLLQICTIYHRKQSSFGVNLDHTLGVLYFCLASKLCQHAQVEWDVQGPSANGHTPVKSFCEVGVKCFSCTKNSFTSQLDLWVIQVWMLCSSVAMKICRCRQGFWYIILTFAVV